MIGGENIYPREVEETYLELIPDIIDIQVFGVSDPFVRFYYHYHYDIIIM